MNTKQPDTLYQSMEKWLKAYLQKYNCTEDEAQDKLDELSDNIRATGKGETATEFHNEIKAATEALLPFSPERYEARKKSVTCQVIPDDHAPIDDGSNAAEIIFYGRRACDTEQTRMSQVQVEYSTTTGKVVKSSVTPISLPAHVGGPLLETGFDPLGFNGVNRSAKTNSLEGPYQRLKDLETRSQTGEGSATRQLINHEENIRVEIDYLEKMITQYKGDQSCSTYQAHLVHVNRLGMLKELRERQAVRTGRVLSLTNKNK